MNKSELDNNTTLDSAKRDRNMTAEDLEVIENEESRQQQVSGLGLLFKGLGFGGNKQQIDPHLMMLVNHLKKEKLSAGAYFCEASNHYIF